MKEILKEKSQNIKEVLTRLQKLNPTLFADENFASNFSELEKISNELENLNNDKDIIFMNKKDLITNEDVKNLIDENKNNLNQEQINFIIDNNKEDIIKKYEETLLNELDLKTFNIETDKKELKEIFQNIISKWNSEKESFEIENFKKELSNLLNINNNIDIDVEKIDIENFKELKQNYDVMKKMEISDKILSNALFEKLPKESFVELEKTLNDEIKEFKPKVLNLYNIATLFGDDFEKIKKEKDNLSEDEVFEKTKQVYLKALSTDPSKSPSITNEINSIKSNIKSETKQDKVSEKDIIDTLIESIIKI